VSRSAGTFRLSFGWRYGGQQQQTKQQSDQFFHGQDFMLPLGSSQGILIMPGTGIHKNQEAALEDGFVEPGNRVEQILL